MGLTRKIPRMHALPALIAMGLCLCVPGYADTLPSKAPATSAISKEPFYADLVKRAERLKHQTEAFSPSVTLLSQRRFRTYADDIRQLTDDDLSGHLDLKNRGTDNDLKCIMKGLSLDLPIKLKAIESAKDDTEMAAALNQMAALLSDHIDVIVTPETADSGLDCVIEFGKN